MTSLQKRILLCASCGVLAWHSVNGAAGCVQAVAGGEAKPAGKTPSRWTGVKVELNTASENELAVLPTVGSSTAKKIIASRPYSSLAELSRAGVPARTIQRITPLVTINGADAQATSSASKRASTPSTERARRTPGSGMVWVNLATRVYHREGDRWYGKTRNGKYMTEVDAIRAGYRAVRNSKKQ